MLLLLHPLKVNINRTDTCMKNCYYNVNVKPVNGFNRDDSQVFSFDFPQTISRTMLHKTLTQTNHCICQWSNPLKLEIKEERKREDRTKDITLTLFYH